jgi:hypothetical protein
LSFIFYVFNLNVCYYLQLEEERRKAEIEHIYGQMKKFEDRLKEFSSEKPDLAKAKEDYEELKRRIADEAIGNYEQIIQLLVALLFLYYKR